MTIGNRISDLRKQKGYTQEYLAERLGVSRQAVSKWEKDQTVPDMKHLIALAEVLDTSLEHLTAAKEPTAQESHQPIIKVLYWIGAILWIAAIVLQFVGLFTGEYTRMVSIGGLGIPFLWYGTSPMALSLMIASGIFMILGNLLIIVGKWLKNCR